MDIYRKFAHYYSRGNYTEYSRRMAQIFPEILRYFKLRVNEILDIACGEGTFAAVTADRGYSVTGLDYSEDMIKIARQKFTGNSSSLRFIQGDMRETGFLNEFDVVTCWFDSMNYLLNKNDLRKTFRGVRKALKTGGTFIFDMNTIYSLAVLWQEPPCYIRQDMPDLFEVHRCSYDNERNIATLRITGFRKVEGNWRRMDEIHRERAYPVSVIRGLLNEAGFEILACWGNIYDKTEPHDKSDRFWIVARKLTIQ